MVGETLRLDELDVQPARVRQTRYAHVSHRVPYQGVWSGPGTPERWRVRPGPFLSPSLRYRSRRSPARSKREQIWLTRSLLKPLTDQRHIIRVSLNADRPEPLVASRLQRGALCQLVLVTVHDHLRILGFTFDSDRLETITQGSDSGRATTCERIENSPAWGADQLRAPLSELPRISGRVRVRPLELGRSAKVNLCHVHAPRLLPFSEGHASTKSVIPPLAVFYMPHHPRVRLPSPGDSRLPVRFRVAIRAPVLAEPM